MEQLVRVRRLNEDGTAQVIHVRQSACSGDCHKCAGCGAVEQTLLVEARNPICAAPGKRAQHCFPPKPPSPREVDSFAA